MSYAPYIAKKSKHKEINMFPYDCGVVEARVPLFVMAAGARVASLAARDVAVVDVGKAVGRRRHSSKLEDVVDVEEALTTDEVAVDVVVVDVVVKVVETAKEIEVASVDEPGPSCGLSCARFGNSKGRLR